MKKKIGLFFGSFNPIHIGHLVIGSYMANYTELNEVWYVVSPQNPFKKSTQLANMYDRLEMVELAIHSSENLKASDIEFSLPKPSYTIDTLIYLQERYPAFEFSIIMGGDNLETLHKWKNYEVLLRDFSIYVYPRPDSNLGPLHDHSSVFLTETPQMEISSTFIRKAIREGKNIQFLMPQEVIEFIDSKGLYS